MPVLRPAPPQPTDADAVGAFELARQRFSAILEEGHRLEDRAEDLRAAYTVLTVSQADAERIGVAVQERAAKAFPSGLPKAKLFPDLIEAAEETAHEFKVKLATARDEWATAVRAETTRIAEGLQPMHRAAVAAIATAVEQLSAALAAEEEVRLELQCQAPELTSALLPNCSDGLLIGRLDTPFSAASRWAAGVRKLRILE